MPKSSSNSLKGDIVVVDDTPANLRLLINMLTRHGHKVRPAPNGHLALKAIQSIPPDLILLDIMMPGMDGYTVCQHLKADQQTQNIPIIFLSALDELVNKVKAFQIGGVDYITKPFQAEEVLVRVETHLALRAMQKQLVAQNEQIQEAYDALEARVDELSTLNLIIQTVATTTDLSTALQIVATTMTRLLNVPVVTISLLNEAQTELSVITQNRLSKDAPNVLGTTIPITYPPFNQQVIEDGQPIVITPTIDNPFLAPLENLIPTQELQSILVVPLVSRSGVVGVLTLSNIEPNREFSLTDIQLTETIAGQIAGAIENARLFDEIQKANDRMSHELSLARDIQQSLLPPSHPDWPQLDVACYTSPAREVGGDFYTYFANIKNRVLLSKYILAVGDVSGKGASAALLMATCLSQFEASLSLSLSPAERLVHLDKAIMPYTKPRGQNCALCYVEIVGANTQQPVLKIVNAACIPPYIRRADGSVEWPDIGGFALGQGLGVQFGYEEMKPSLAKGDMLILVSDGVIEANNEAGHMFGFEAFQKCVASGPTTTAQEMLAYLKQVVFTFAGEAEQHDDITIVVIRV